MPLSDLFTTLTEYLHTKVFRDLARHPEHPAAFTRHRKLTLPTLISFMLGNLSTFDQDQPDTASPTAANSAGVS